MFNIELLYNPTILFLYIPKTIEIKLLKRSLSTHVYCNIIPNSQKSKAAKVSTDKGEDKKCSLHNQGRNIQPSKKGNVDSQNG